MGHLPWDGQGGLRAWSFDPHRNISDSVIFRDPGFRVKPGVNFKVGFFWAVFVPRSPRTLPGMRFSEKSDRLFPGGLVFFQSSTTAETELTSPARVQPLWLGPLP